MGRFPVVTMLVSETAMVIHDDWMIWENPMTLGTSLVGALEHYLFFYSVGNNHPK